MRSRPKTFSLPQTWLRLGLLWYLLIVIGFVAPAHRHQTDNHFHGDVDCQLCQVTAGVFLTPSFGVDPLTAHFFEFVPPSPVSPVLFSRHNSFSSRGPPFV